jgi:uncharacterized protein
MLSMAIDRRSVLIGSGALALSPRAAAGGRCGSELFVSACREESGGFAAVTYAEGCGIVSRVALPARGHDLVQRPGTRECVVFARRPGTFAVAFSSDDSAAPAAFKSRPDRHFFGHGVFSADGRLLYTSENDFEAARGVIGVRDATAGYRQTGEFDAGGMEPHDLCLLSDGRTLVIANGGLETHPSSERESLNVAMMEPSLIHLDTETGDVLEVHRLPASMHKLSIRHLAVARGDLVCFGCQHQGSASEHPALIGLHKRGIELRLIEAGPDIYRPLRNYVGSVSADAGGDLVAASSPRGGVALIIDPHAGRVIGTRRREDVCGVAARHARGGFLLTSGLGFVDVWPAEDGAAPHREHLAWDNHVISLGLD